MRSICNQVASPFCPTRLPIPSPLKHIPCPSLSLSVSEYYQQNVHHLLLSFGFVCTRRFLHNPCTRHATPPPTHSLLPAGRQEEGRLHPNSALQLSVNVSCHSVSPSVCQSPRLSVSIYVTSAPCAILARRQPDRRP